MTQHKWHKEIKAWADGAEIEQHFGETWNQVLTPSWHRDTEYRIKPQPKERISAKELIKQVVDEYNASCDKEPQYINVYGYLENQNVIFRQQIGMPYIGKIKLEVDDA